MCIVLYDGSPWCDNKGFGKSVWERIVIRLCIVAYVNSFGPCHCNHQYMYILSTCMMKEQLSHGSFFNESWPLFHSKVYRYDSLFYMDMSLSVYCIKIVQYRWSLLSLILRVRKLYPVHLKNQWYYCGFLGATYTSLSLVHLLPVVLIPRNWYNKVFSCY